MEKGDIVEVLKKYKIKITKINGNLIKGKILKTGQICDFTLDTITKIYRQ